ncbi:hypothetical protein MTX20_06025 [Bradyrhizobium sp. ISRA435]|nr:hypothetical protein MTX20_06025 [Bradyrhizobium sp. ISRA435]
MALIYDGAHVSLRDAAQLPHERDFIVRPPCGDRQPAALRQGPPHLRRRRRLIGKELQSLLAHHNLELLPVTQGQGSGIAFAPVDPGRHGSRNSKHVGTDIDADDVSGVTEPFSCYACHYSRSTGNIEDAIAGR